MSERKSNRSIVMTPFSLILGFGPGVRILTPNSVVREMKRKIKKAAELYEEPLPDSTEK